MSHSKLTVKAIKVSSIHLPPTLVPYALPAASAEPQCTCTTVGTSGEIFYSCDCMVGLELSEAQLSQSAFISSHVRTPFPHRPSERHLLPDMGKRGPSLCSAEHTALGFLSPERSRYICLQLRRVSEQAPPLRVGIIP